MREMDGTETIDCVEAERRLHRYVDRELSDTEAAQVQQHLDMCDNCRARFRFEFGLRRLVHGAGQNEPPPADLRDRIRRLGRQNR